MAPTIGQKLRSAREERGAELPAPVYARGFLDIYARHLGLDQQELLDEYSRAVEGEPHEPVPGTAIKPGTLRHHGPARRVPHISVGPAAKVAAGLLVLVVIGLVIIGLIGGSDGGGNEKGAKRKDAGTKAVAPTTPTTTTAPTTPSDVVSVELRATATVWVCLVDERGTAVVDSETLSADDSRGPFRSARFDVTFGNGSVEMTVDGQPANIPQVAQPIGYRISPTGMRELAPSSDPTCL
jgi:hypothetical protein